MLSEKNNKAVTAFVDALLDRQLEGEIQLKELITRDNADGSTAIAYQMVDLCEPNAKVRDYKHHINKNNVHIDIQ